jgi:hypothetical protein
MPTPHRQIRASYNDETIAVYQAYPNEIADPALPAGTFVAPFAMSRMTWIKPSFLWMAYRSGWATKPNQTRVLRITITREGFEWALTHSCLSHYDRKHHASEAAWRSQLRESPVRIQWDPEQTLHLQPQPSTRSIQIGLSGRSSPPLRQQLDHLHPRRNPQMHTIQALAQSSPTEAAALLPTELPYPLTDHLAQQIAATPSD